MSLFQRMHMFTQVIELNSFSGAAKKLKISTAAVSKQISLLEEEVEMQLLRRSTRRLELTELGQPFYEKCRELVQNFEEVKSLATHLLGEPVGELRVVSTLFFAEKFVVPYLSDFLNENPKLVLNLELSERIPNLENEKVDILYAISLPGSPEWIQKPISKTRYVFCASPSYISKFGNPRKPSEISEHHYIAHMMRKPYRVLDFGSGEKLHINPRLILNDTRAMLDCALDGLGIVRLHSYMVSESIKKKQLVEVWKEYNQTDVNIYLYYQPSKYVQPKIRAFIDFFAPKIGKVI